MQVSALEKRRITIVHWSAAEFWAAKPPVPLSEKSVPTRFRLIPGDDSDQLPNVI
jgi:hypothetical protein